MEYNNYDKHHNEPVDAFIMQGSISDREAYEHVQTLVSLAKEMIDAGRGDDVVPKSKLPPNMLFPSPMTAYRLHSLSAVGYVVFLSSDVDAFLLTSGPPAAMMTTSLPTFLMRGSRKYGDR